MENINNKKQKKFALLKFFCMFVVVLLAIPFFANAATIPDIFVRGLDRVNEFFTPNNPYADIIDFAFFALLLTAIYMMGARYAFKEVKNPEKAIVILLGLISAYLLVLADVTTLYLLPYIHYLFYVLLFILYWHLLKGIKNKLLRFLLALLLAILTIWLLSGLVATLTVPKITPEIPGIEVEAPRGLFANLFGSLGDAFRGIKVPTPQLPEIKPPKLPEAPQPGAEAPVTPTSTLVEKGEKPAEKEKKKIPDILKWLPLAIGLVLLAVAGVLKVRKRRERKEKKEKGDKKPVEVELTLKDIINKLSEITKKKQDILNKIKEIIKKKKSDIERLHDRYWKILKYDAVFWTDPDSEAFKQFMKQQGEVGELIVLEFELEKELQELMNLENEILRDAKKWLNILAKYNKEKAAQIIAEIEKIEKETPLLFWERAMDTIKRIWGMDKEFPQWYKDTMSRILDIFAYLFLPRQLCDIMRKYIAYYFLIAKDDERREKVWNKLIQIKTLQKWTRNKDKWKPLSKYTPDQIKDHFEKEEKFFNEQFKPALMKQIRYMFMLIRYLKYLEAEREKFTEMQELSVEYVDASGNKKPLTKEQAVQPTNAIPKEIPIRIYTLLATGIGPFKLYCIIDGMPIRTPPYVEIEKKEAHPVIEWTPKFTDLTEGEHTITYLLVSTTRATETPPTPIAQKWRDTKSIKINIGPAAQPPVTSTPPQTIAIPIGVIPASSGTVSISYIENGQNKTEATDSQATINADINSDFEIIANPPLNFLYWNNRRITSNPLKDKIRRNLSGIGIIAYFTAPSTTTQQINLTFGSNPSGSGYVAVDYFNINGRKSSDSTNTQNTISVKKGTAMLFETTPEQGYEFSHWEVNGVIRNRRPILTYPGIVNNNDVNVFAVFVKAAPSTTPQLAAQVQQITAISGFDFDVGIAESVGNPDPQKRRYKEQQDAHFSDKKFMGNQGWYFGGVYDGHSGADASRIASESLHQSFMQHLSTNKNVKDSFIDTYRDTSNFIDSQTTVGTTSANLFIAGNRAFISHVGDTKIIVCVDDKNVFSTKHHQPSDQDEKARIEREGGVVIVDEYGIPRLNGNLMVSRALGDKNVGPGLSHIPDVGSLSLSNLAKKGIVRIIICCDGVFETSTNIDGTSIDEAVTEVSKYSNAQDSATALMQLALNRGTTDNVTVMVVKLIPLAKDQIKRKVINRKEISIEKSKTQPTPTISITNPQQNAPLEIGKKVDNLQVDYDDIDNTYFSWEIEQGEKQKKVEGEEDLKKLLNEFGEQVRKLPPIPPAK